MMIMVSIKRIKREAAKVSVLKLTEMVIEIFKVAG